MKIENPSKPSASQVVPFGKYKGQPVEVLRNDPEYVAWLQGQDWFRSRHPQIVQIIVNNFGEANETPDHNRLQAMFLGDKFCQKFAHEAVIGWANEPTEGIHIWGREFEISGWDVRFNVKFPSGENNVVYVEIKPSLGDYFPAVLRQMKANSDMRVPRGRGRWVTEDIGGIKCLMYDGFSATGATEDQIVRIIMSSGFEVVKLINLA